MARTEKTIKIIIDGDTKRINNSLMTTERALAQFKAKWQKNVKESFQFTGHGKTPFFMKMFGPLMTGAAIYGAIRNVAALDKQIQDYRRTAGLSIADSMKFKQGVLDAGIKAGVATDELLRLSTAAYETSKSTDFVAQNTEYLAKAYMAIGGDASTFGATMGKINRELGLSGPELEKFVDGLYSIGKATGTETTLQKMLPSMPELLDSIKTYYGEAATNENVTRAVATAMIGGGPQALQQMLAKMTTPDVKKKITQGLGIKLIDGKGAKRDVTAVIKDIIHKTKDNKGLQESVFGSIFGARTAADINDIVSSFGDLDRVVSRVDLGGVRRKGDEESRSFSGAMARLGGVWTKISDEALAPGMQAFADAMMEMDPEALKGLTDGFSALGKFVSLLVIGTGELLTKWQEFAAWLGRFLNSDAIIKTMESGFSQELNDEVSALYRRARESKLAGDMFGYEKSMGEASRLKSTGERGMSKYSRMTREQAMSQVKADAGIVAPMSLPLQAPTLNHQTNVFIDGKKIEPNLVTDKVDTGKQMNEFNDPKAFHLVR